MTKSMTPQSLCLMEIDNPVNYIEHYEEGRETLQEEVVNSVNTWLLDLSFQWPLVTSRNRLPVAVPSSGPPSLAWTHTTAF